MSEMSLLQRLWLRLIDVLAPYLISPIGRPTRWRFVTAMAADRMKRPVVLNRYPRQVIGVGIRLPDFDMYVAPRKQRTLHPYLSVVWSKPHGAGRWKRTAVSGDSGKHQ